MAADEIERAVMGPAELVGLELLVGFEREVAVGIEHQLYALAQFLIAQEQRVSGRSGFHHAINKWSVCADSRPLRDYRAGALHWHPRVPRLRPGLGSRHSPSFSEFQPIPRSVSLVSLAVAQRLVLDLGGGGRQMEAGLHARIGG